MENQIPIHRQDKELDKKNSETKASVASESEIHIFLTDITLHATKPRKPHSFARKIEKSMRNGKPGRVHFNCFPEFVGCNVGSPSTLIMPLPKEMLQLLQGAQLKNRRIRFFIPKSGIPIIAGKDAVEKAKALRKKGRS